MKFEETKIAEYKKKYGEDNVYLCEVGERSCLVHKPTRRDLSFAMVGSNGGKDAVKMQEILLKQCWIDGDGEIMTNDDDFFAVSALIADLMEVKQAELKKL